MSEKVDLDSVEVYSNGRLQLIVGLCEKMGFVDLIWVDLPIFHQVLKH